MISLKDYIYESALGYKDYYIVHHLDIPSKKMTSDEIKKMLKEAAESAISTFDVIRLEAVEKYNKRLDQMKDDDFKVAYEKAVKYWLKYKESKPGILKRSPAKQQEWLDKKIADWKEYYEDNWESRHMRRKVEYNKSQITFGFHSDLYTNNSYSLYTSIDDMINGVIRTIGDLSDENWSHLKSIDFCLRDKNTATEYWAPRFMVVPVFDEEKEKEFSDAIARFSDYMCRQYSSGRYMGD